MSANNGGGKASIVMPQSSIMQPSRTREPTAASTFMSFISCNGCTGGGMPTRPGGGPGSIVLEPSEQVMKEEYEAIMADGEEINFLSPDARFARKTRVNK